MQFKHIIIPCNDENEIICQVNNLESIAISDKTTGYIFENKEILQKLNIKGAKYNYYPELTKTMKIACNHKIDNYPVLCYFDPSPTRVTAIEEMKSQLNYDKKLLTVTESGIE